MSAFYYLLLTAMLLWLSWVLWLATNSTHGPGSWRLDNELRLVSGVLLGWAFIPAGLAISEAISYFYS